MSIYKFLGRLSLRKLGDNDVQSEALGLENTLWANTVVTHGPVYGLVVYTGVDSRTVMSYDDNASDDKTCLLDKQVDFCAKVPLEGGDYPFCITSTISLVQFAICDFERMLRDCYSWCPSYWCRSMRLQIAWYRV